MCVLQVTSTSKVVENNYASQLSFIAAFIAVLLISSFMTSFFLQVSLNLLAPSRNWLSSSPW